VTHLPFEPHFLQPTNYTTFKTHERPEPSTTHFC
jgi:hypothetical protein